MTNPVNTVNSPAEVHFENISATPDTFSLRGGLYQVNAVATWGGGSVTLEQRGPDGVTFLSVITAITANGGQTIYIPQGTYKLVVVTATAIYVDITPIRVPGVV